MMDSTRQRDAPAELPAAADVRILDGGTRWITPSRCAAVVRKILDGQLAQIASDRNSTCYRVDVGGNDSAPRTAIVKVPRPGPQRSNADATFAVEAAILARLPDAGIANAPQVLARVVTAGRHFLFTTELAGRHPDPRRHPLDATQFHALLAIIQALDTRGIVHYDLKPANILLDADRAAFIDFEFAQFGDVCAAYAPATAAWCADFNVSANPHFPARSNLANFEFRTLHRHLAELGAAHSTAAADTLLRDYLRARSGYHLRMAGFLTDLAATSAERIAALGEITVAQTRRRLDGAAAYERLLAGLLSEPRDPVTRVEWAVMAYRRHVFERQEDQARQARRHALAALDDASVGADALPRSYDEATRATLDRVASSAHPLP